MSEMTVPDGWEFTRLDTVVDKFLVPMRDKPKVFSGEIPWVRIEDFIGKYLYESKSKRCVNQSTIDEMRLKVYPEGTVLCSCSARLGVCTIIANKMVSNQTFIGLVPGNEIDKEYLFYRMEYHADDLQKLSSGTTIAYLPIEKFEEFPVLVPPLPEQKKNASILTSVDNVIENTQKQIDKLQDLKKATMNELLTKGIGHTEFKDSELGRIPTSWGVTNIAKLTQLVTSGSRGWSQYYSSAGPLFIRIGNLTRDHINLKFADIQHVEPPSDGEGTRTKIKVGDILVSITADLGVIGVANESLGEAYVNQHVCLVRLESVSDVNPRWLGHFLSGHAGQEQFEKKNDGGAKAGLNLTTIRSIVVLLPSPQEQNKIVSVFDRLDLEISIKQRKLEKHQSLKKSLMQDLLTGKVRVTVN